MNDTVIHWTDAEVAKPAAGKLILICYCTQAGKLYISSGYYVAAFESWQDEEGLDIDGVKGWSLMPVLEVSHE